MTTTPPTDPQEATQHRTGDRWVDIDRSNFAPIVSGDGNQITTVQAVPPVAFPPPGDVRASNLVRTPRAPTRVFVGRDGQLARLVQAMSSADDVLISQAVVGLGGVGKSELALQYAHQHRARYAVVWWVSADDPQQVEAGLAGLARELVPEAARHTTAEDAARWAVSWLNHHPGWLLIFDNVNAPTHIEPWLAALARGHVLITSRRDVRWPGATPTLHLDVLDEEPAVTLLTQVSGQTDPVEHDLAAQIAEELGYLPLALDQAAAYIQQTRTPLNRYLRTLREQPAQTHQATADSDKSQATIARLWDITLEILARTSPHSIATLRMLACYYPDDIPRALARPSPDIDQLAIDRALGVLASHSMIKLTSELISIHRLTQAVILHTTPDTHPRDTALTCLFNLLPPDPQSNIDGWPLWQTLLPHIDRLAAHYAAEQQPASLGTLFNETAVFLIAQGRPQRAQMLLTKAITIAESAYGPDNPHVAVKLGNLAATYRDLGQPAKAKQLSERALAIAEGTYGPDNPHVVDWLGNLAATYRDLGQPAKAMSLEERALAITETTYGPDHPTVAVRLGNLAATYRDLGRPAQALATITRAERCATKTLGAGHATTRSLQQAVQIIKDYFGVPD